MLLPVIIFMLAASAALAQCPPQGSIVCNPPVNSFLSMDFNDGSIRDYSSSNVQFTVNGNAIIADGVMSSASDADHIYAESHGLVGPGSRTIAYWVFFSRWRSGAGNGTISAGRDSSGKAWTTYTFSRDYKMSFNFNGSYVELASTNWVGAVVTNRWYHHVVTYDEGTLALLQYVNGEYDQGSIIGGPLNTAAEPLYVGRDLWGRGLFGRIDDLMFYKYALTPNEIRELYQKGKAEGK